MAISSLSAQYISASFQNLIQISSSGQVFDGLGNAITNLTASFTTTASYISPTFISASAAASGFGSGGTGTTINTSSFATTGSNTFNGSQTINGDLTITGSITAYQYVISSSVINETIVFSSGSTIFGNDANDTHTFEGSIIMSGSANISSASYIDFDINASSSYLEGRVHWIDDTKTLNIDTDVSNFSVEVGHQNVVRVRNVTGDVLTKGKIVYINGESGNRPTVATASWDGDPTSATTLGWIAQNISDNQTGYVITNGILRDINTNAFSPGTQLYLSSSGDYTSTIPVSPKHEVRLGKVITQATSGTIYVDVMNGYEIGELHDVLVVSSSVGDLLVNSGSVWINTKQLTGSYAITGSLTVSGSSTFKVIGPSEFTGSVAINGTLSAPAASITAQSVSSDTVTATNSISGSQILLNGHTISASIGDSLDTNGTYTSTLTIQSDNSAGRQIHIDPFTDTVIESANVWINSSDVNGTETGLFLNTTFVGIPTHDKTPFTNQQVARQNGVYIGTMNAHPSDKSVYPGFNNGLYGPVPTLTILPFSGSFIGGQWVTHRPNQIGINKYDSKFSTNFGSGLIPEMGSLSATLDVNGSTVISGSLTVTASINATSVTASLFGTASYAVNSLTASYALSGGSGGTSSTVSTAQTGSVTGTTSETVIQTLTIPANTLSTNDFARFSTKIFATNSNNYTVALYINSTNTLNGSEKNITTLPVNSSIKFVIPTRTIAVNNVTTDTNWISENTQVQEPFQGSSAVAHASSSIDWTATQYALVSVTPQNAGDSFICRGTYFEKI